MTFIERQDRPGTDREQQALADMVNLLEQPQMQHGSYYERNGNRSEDRRDRLHQMVRDYQEQMEWTRSGMDRIVLALVQGFPFRISGAALSDLRKLSNGELYEFAKQVGAGRVTDEASLRAAMGQGAEEDFAPNPRR